MKKTLFLALAIAIVACKEEPKDYATLSGKITDKNSDSLVVRSRTYSKTIKVNEDGTFKDTLKVTAGVYNLFDGKESTYLFLKDDVDVNLTLDTKEFDESIVYTGKGSETSNYLAQFALLREKELSPDLFTLEESALQTKIEAFQNKYAELLETYKNMDSTILAGETKQQQSMGDAIMGQYKQMEAQKEAMASLTGKESPKFVDYENYAGGTTSLSDLEGKYVYIDVWATWCGPCKREIPFLKEVEKKYHGKNIEFVSVSIDNKKDHEKWKTMVADKELGGIQLFADNDWKSQFVQDYQIKGIPRFILIGPDGKIVNADAPRPSSSELVELFDELKI